MSLIIAIIAINTIGRNIWILDDNFYFLCNNLSWILAAIFFIKNTISFTKIISEFMFCLICCNMIDELLFVPYAFTFDKYIIPLAMAAFAIYQLIKIKNVRRKRRSNRILH